MSYNTSVLPFANLAALPATGVKGVIYITEDDDAMYRWNGSTYVALSSSGGALNFTALSGTTITGGNKYTTLTADTDLILDTINTETYIRVEQDSTGGWLLTINGDSIAINTLPDSLSLVGILLINGNYEYSVNNGLLPLADTPIPDVTVPTLVSAIVENANADRVLLVFSEAMNATWSATAAFGVTGHTVSSVTRTGATTGYLTLSAPFVNGETARTLSYTQPGSNKMQDLAGNLLANISSAAITNNVAGQTLYDVSYNQVLNISESPSHQWNNTNSGGTDPLNTKGLDTTHSVPSGTDVILYTTLASADNIAVFIGLDDNNTFNCYEDGSFNALWKFTVTAANNIIVFQEYNGSWSSQLSQAVTLPYASTSRYGIRVRSASTTPIIEVVYSTNGGTSWSVAYTFSTTYSGTLYSKLGFSLPSVYNLNPKILIG